MIFMWLYFSLPNLGRPSSKEAHTPRGEISRLRGFVFFA